MVPVDAILRGEGAFATGRGAVPWRALLLAVGIAGGLAGVALGAFQLRPLQMLYSGAKVPLLLVLSCAVCLPSFFVLNTVLGLRDDLSAALRAVLTAQAAVALGLAALAPITAFTYLVSRDYALAVVLNGVYFAVATAGGQLALRRHYAPLVAADRRHRVVAWSWVVVYDFVAIQLAWVLRPFVGSPGVETRFLREDAWSNAYVVVAEAVVRALGW